MFWNKDSMLYWWELVKDLPVPKPKTKILRLDEETVMIRRWFQEDLEFNLRVS